MSKLTPGTSPFVKSSAALVPSLSTLSHQLGLFVFQLLIDVIEPGVKPMAPARVSLRMPSSSLRWCCTTRPWRCWPVEDRHELPGHLPLLGGATTAATAARRISPHITNQKGGTINE